MKRILIHSGVHPEQGIDFKKMDFEKANHLLGNNSGNLLFSYAMFKFLEGPGASLKSDGYRLPVGDYSADYINENFDYLVIPASNWISQYFCRILPLLTQKIRKLKIPCILMGVGAQSDAAYSFDFLKPIERVVKDFLAAISEKSSKIGVRGEFTARCLERLGFKNHSMVGCPSLYLFNEKIKEKILAKLPFGKKGELRFAINSTDHYFMKFLFLLRKYPASSFFDQSNLKYIYYENLLSENEKKIYESSGLGAELTFLARKKRLFLFGNVGAWRDELSHYDLTLGSRIHGNITSLLSGTPACMVYHDSRTRELAELHDIPSISMSRFDAKFDPIAFFDKEKFGKFFASNLIGRRKFISFLNENDLPHNMEAVEPISEL